MPSPKRLLTSIVTLAMLSTTLVGTAYAAGATLEQVRNGTATATSTPTPTWATGNAGSSNSHYLESHSIPYRAVLSGLPTDGTVIELVLGYAVKRSGSYAIDYLTNYQRVLPHVMFGHTGPETFDPLSGVSGVSATVTTAPIPVPSTNVMVDPDGAQSEPAALQPATNMSALTAAERAMTLFGGTLIDVTYVVEGDVGLATSASESHVKVRFTADSPNAVLAWGGHIACRWDWGFNGDGSPRSAGGISGSSYHMQVIGWNLGSVGNQSRSMSTDAVYPVPRCAVSNSGPFCANTNNTHTAPSGMESYSWSFGDNSSGATIVGGSTSSSVVVNSGSGGSYTLVLTTGASGFTKPCQSTITVNAPAWANAGLDQTVCSTSPQVTLDGQVGGGSGSWSGGSGTWSPNATAMGAIYTPSAAEINAGGVTLTLTASAAQCGSVSDQVRINIQRAATANAGTDLIVCATTPAAQLAGIIGGGATSGTWSGGAGSFNPSAAALNAVYTPTAEEIAAGSVTLTLTSDAVAGPCAQVSDQVKITINPAATANAGLDREVCSSAAQVQLAGQVGGGAASGTWSGGNGSFAPNATTLNATYTPTAAEIAAGGLTLTLTSNDPAGPCGAVNDQVRIDIRPAATVNAGIDFAVCSSSPQAQLAGVVGGGAASGTWTGGNGSFSPSASALNAVYTPTAAEVAAGAVTLTLTTNDPAGPCDARTDQVTISIQPAATVSAGVDMDVCSTSPQVQLAGQVGGGAASGTWSGGTGTFNPNASALNATYTPSAAEIAAGGVTLTLTTNDPAGPCGALNDQMRIVIGSAAGANAGADLSVCSTSPQAQLAGTVTGGASSGTWSGGNGSFNPSASALNAIYTPTAAEIAAGSVTLTLTSADVPGACSQVADQVTLTILPAATVNAGIDRDVCSSSPQVQLAGQVGGGATSGMWSGGTGTWSPNASTLNATYLPSAAEIAAGSVTLTLTTNDPAGPCGALSNDMRITIRPEAIVNAGTDLASCSTSPRVQLQGSVSGGASSGTWSGGNGTFSPNASTLNAQYTPSAAEIAAGTVTLTLTSTAGSGPCPIVSDQVSIVISQAVTVNAGADQIICPVTPEVQLAGSIGNGALSGTWTGGLGQFQPNATTLNAIYVPTAAEIAAGSITLTLTTNDPEGSCPAVGDQMRITVSAPRVAVQSKSTCWEITSSQLCADITGGVAPYTYLWSTGATTRCIAVSDTGSYTVTITDSKGCADTATGRFTHRDCAGMLAHTNTTCESYMNGGAAPILDDEINMSVRDGVIGNIAPGVMFYFTIFTAPSADFRVDIVQENCPGFRMIEVLHAQVSLYDANCSGVSGGALGGNGQAYANITGATPGQAYVLSVKYSLKSLVGMALPEGAGCKYEFITKVNGVEVDRDPEGLQIGTVQPEPEPTSGTPPSGGTGGGDDPSGEIPVTRGPEGEKGGTPPPTGPQPDAGDGGGEQGNNEDIIQRGGGDPPAPAPGPTPEALGPPIPVGTGDTGTTTTGIASTPALGNVVLERPMPNPFRGDMRMAYSVATDGTGVEISVFDLAGRRMKSLASGTQSAGIHNVHWDGRDESGAQVRKGMYFVHIRIGGQARQVRVTFVN